MTQIDNILALIVKTSVEFNDEHETSIAWERGRDAQMYGEDGVLDSLGLVSFIATLEQAIEDEWNVSLTLADEKAMSRHSSPFLTIGTLSDYVTKLLGDVI